MRKKYPAILLAVVMACITVFPAAAAENVPDSDVQAIASVADEAQEDTEQAPAYDDSESEDGQTQGTGASLEESLGDVEEPSSEEVWNQSALPNGEDAIEEESAQEEIGDEENPDDALLDGDTEDTEEELIDEYAIATLAVTNGFGQGEDGNWYYYTNGQIDTGMNSVIQGVVNGVNAWWYVVGGKVQLTFTGLADYSNANGWWYINEGKVDFSYNGFANNSNGWWYIDGGKVIFSTNSVIKGTVNGTNAWWYVVGGKVQETFTGLADYSNSNGWWYIENGKVTFTKDTIAHNKNGWFYVKDSKVDFNFTGLADFPNENGWWYIEKGKVTFTKNTIAHNKNGWWYIKGSKVDFNFTGLADFSNENGWWYCEGGQVKFNHTGVEQNKNGWFYVSGSKVQFSYNGFANNSNGWWYIENGKVTFNKNSVIQGTVNGTNAWWYVVGSKVQTGFTGLADYSNSNGWWYINNGKVTFNYTGIAKNKNGWYYCEDSKVLFDEPLALAAKFVGAHSSANASNSDKLSSVFSYMRANYNYTLYYGVPTAADLPSYAVDYFTSMTGNCYRHAAACTCVAKVLGYETRTAVGTIDTGNGPSAHGWCEVNVNGTWYILDVGFNVYMKTMEQYPDTLAVDNRYTLNVVNGKAVWQ